MWPAGRLEAFWEFNLNPWDTAAGILLVEEAGGRVTDFAGNPFKLDSREVLASNGLIQGELVELFKEMFAGRGLVADSHAAGVCQAACRKGTMSLLIPASQNAIAEMGFSSGAGVLLSASSS